MNKPDLSGVIEAKDVNTIQIPTKNGGSYKAKYMAWAKIKQLLNKHADGWDFHLSFYQDGQHVWPAPDGTGYLMCHFIGPDNEETSDFPFPIMDNRNMPVKIENISARTLTDSHRRALCASACFHFSLGFQLWCDEEISEKSEPIPSFSTPISVADSKPKQALKQRVSKADKEACMQVLKDYKEKHPQGFKDLYDAYGEKFPDFLKMEKPSFNLHALLQEHFEFIDAFLKNYEMPF